MRYSFQGYQPELADDVFVAPTAAVIGDVVLGAGSSVWFHCVLRGDVSKIRIGAQTNIQDATVIHVSSLGDGPGYDTLIGDRVTVGHCCLVHACTVEDGAFVGMGSTVMDGAVIERLATLGAGSLLPPGKRVPSGQLWVGRPARYHRMLTQEEQDDMWHRQADHYVNKARKYLAEMG